MQHRAFVFALLVCLSVNTAHAAEYFSGKLAAESVANASKNYRTFADMIKLVEKEYSTDEINGFKDSLARNKIALDQPLVPFEFTGNKIRSRDGAVQITFGNDRTATFRGRVFKLPPKTKLDVLITDFSALSTKAMRLNTGCGLYGIFPCAQALPLPLLAYGGWLLLGGSAAAFVGTELYQAIVHGEVVCDGAAFRLRKNSVRNLNKDLYWSYGEKTGMRPDVVSQILGRKVTECTPENVEELKTVFSKMTPDEFEAKTSRSGPKANQ